MVARTDYDALAERYDEDRRGRVYDPDWFVKWKLDEGVASLVVLDVGCGPGRWLEQQMKHFTGCPVRWVGVDPFAGMLALARRNAPQAELVQAGAEHLPFPDGGFDLAHASVSYHHFEDKEIAFDEIVRVLRPGGCFEIGDIEPWSMRGWWSYRYFPESWELDAAKHWPPDRLVEALVRRGLKVDQPARWPQRTKTRIEDVLAAAERRILSQLASLDEPAYQRGLARVRAVAAEQPDVELDDEFCFFGLVATNPGQTGSARVGQ